MGKSDLIEKINARVKSQMNTLTARTGVKSRADEKDDRGVDQGDKRITNSRTGTVVVRRRTPPRAEGEGGAANGDALEVAGAPVQEQVAEVREPEVSAPVVKMEQEPEVVAAPEPVRVQPAPPVQEAPQPREERAPVREEVAPTPPPRPVAQPRPTEYARPRDAEYGRGSRDSEYGRGSRDSEYGRGTRDSDFGRGPREPEVVTRHLPVEQPAPELGQQDAGDGDMAAATPNRVRSIEDVLAQERGRVPVQHRAMVVGQGPVQTPQHRPEGRQPMGASGALGNSPQGQGQQGGPAGNQARRVPQSPTSLKEIANEERKKEKAVAKVVPGRPGVPGRGPVAVEEADRRGVKAPKKGMKKKEVLQRKDVASDMEPQFRKQRRLVAKREKAKPKITTPKAIKRVIKIEDTISVGELSHRMGVKAPAVIKKLMALGMMATINQSIDHDTASMVAADFGYEVENVAFDEQTLLAATEDLPADLVRRPPVVTVMGHVDHGKTTLLDAIRNTDHAAKEAGGITQHIGAYTVETSGGRIVFLDTPGHEAFTAMRARGAQVTDIVILVVAADDGVMPQTVEALNHAKEARVPIIVAVNKIDKPGANPERIRQKLSEYELVPEEWGGQTIFREVSAKSRVGIEELLEYVLLQAEVLELRANPNRQARATVVESQLDKGRGPVATVLVLNGTLRVGDVVVVGAQYGKVRAMVDDKGKQVKEAGPAMPVEILGLSGVPDAGDTLAVVEDLDAAKTIAESRSDRAREQNMAKSAKVTLEDLFSQIQKNDVKELRLILKTDVQGSLAALEKSILELSTEQVKTNVLHSGVGAISEGDVMLASASKALIVGFNVKADPKSSSLAEQEGVQIKTYNVIYDALDELRASMQGLLGPVFRERIIGHAEVRNTFSIPKIGLIAGTSVTDGKITRNAHARVMRGGKQIWEGKLASLRRFKDDVKEVVQGYECGIGLDNFTDVQLGDVIEAFVIDESRATL